MGIKVMTASVFMFIYVIHIFKYGCERVNICMWICMYICMFAYVFMYVDIYVDMYAAASDKMTDADRRAAALRFFWDKCKPKFNEVLGGSGGGVFAQSLVCLSTFFCPFPQYIGTALRV